MALSPEQRAEKAAASRSKALERRRVAAKERLRQLGTARAGNEAKKRQIAAAIEGQLPDALAAGVTYDDMAALTGLSRARVAQILAEWRGKNPVADEAEPEKPTNGKGKAKATNGAGGGVVAAVADL